jgi:hypothetical protein
LIHSASLLAMFVVGRALARVGVLDDEQRAIGLL